MAAGDGVAVGVRVIVAVGVEVGVGVRVLVAVAVGVAPGADGPLGAPPDGVVAVGVGAICVPVLGAGRVGVLRGGSARRLPRCARGVARR